MSHDETSSTLTAKDKYHAYYVSQIIAGADLDTFNGWRDKNWIYQNGERWGPAVLLSDLYAKDLPSICVEKGYIPTSTMPAIFSKDLSVVGYATFSTVCVIDTKTRQPQYFPYGTDNGVGLSDDGSKLLYQVYESEGAAMNGVTCSDCGTYFIDRATGKTGKLK